MSDRSHIRKAVIPSAGHGTRLRPLTNITPKEMLPLGKKPVVEYIIEELQASGIDDIIFVVSPAKTEIEEYFGDTACGGKVRLQYVTQEKQLGLADAILRAEESVYGEHFAVALGDTVMFSRHARSPLQRLIAAYKKNPASAAIVVEQEKMEHCDRYGIVKPAEEICGESFEIDWLVEKPEAGEAPSCYAIGGRYLFGPEIFDLIRDTEPGVGGEQQITDSVKLAIARGGRAWCVPIDSDERRYDIGNFDIYCEAFIAACMLDPELKLVAERAAKFE